MGDKKQCFDIPTTTCEKVTSQKCFTVKTPPKLVQVPKANCGGGSGSTGSTGSGSSTGGSTGGSTGSSGSSGSSGGGGGGGGPRIHHIHIAAPQVHHAPAHSHTHQTHFVPSVAAAAPVVAASPIVATTGGFAGGVGLSGVALGNAGLGGGVALGGAGLGGGVAAVHPGFGGGSHQSVSTPHSHHHSHVDNNRFGK